ncbi:hypothetical protein [Taibaiella koreensis]|uniref:hypothetical protein n=1 Tax=Taibaiella koreensis TaxID=1268548 RepID=UPI000E59A642|nr:hypothetical protein [Taibaiella koreensis]
MNQVLSGIDELEAAFRRITGDRYRYVIAYNAAGSGAMAGREGLLLVQQNAYHGVEIRFVEKDGRQFLSTAWVSPNSLLRSLMRSSRLLDRFIARPIFGTRRQLVIDVNEVIVSAFPVTVLDSGLPGRSA